MNTLLFLKIVLVFAVLLVVQIPVRRAGNSLLRTESQFSYRHGALLCATYVALIGDSAADAIEYLFRRILGGKKNNGRLACNQKTIAALGFAICVALTAYGYVNSQQFVRNVHQWNVDGLKRGHTFAFVSDIHAGSAQPMEKLRDLCRQIPSVP